MNMDKEDASQMKEKGVYKIGVWNIAFPWDVCELSAPHALHVRISMKAVYFIARVAEYGEWNEFLRSKLHLLTLLLRHD